MDIIVGTAGHIDHGKTALVKALTGTDADRLPEEKQRGITIDLGFAELDLGEVRIGFVDVPGHERFVKNMLAGAQGIDLVMLVVAADEGVMPQTREHFEICRLLGVETGLVVLTKSDLVDNELAEIARLDVAELVAGSFLEGAPVMAASARTGDGIEKIKSALLDAARKVPERRKKAVPRIPIDRSFTVKGFGTVVTGTLLSGEIATGDELEILPDVKKIRVRGIQTHGKTVGSVHAGQRAAVNLAGIEHTEITRGMVLCEREVLRPTQMLDAEIEVLKDAAKALRSRQRVRVHIGTVEALARVQVLNESGEILQGKTDFAQLRLEAPVVALPGDRFIIRSYSPQSTIAGGRLLDTPAKKHRRKDIPATTEFLQRLIGADTGSNRIEILLAQASESGLGFADLRSRTGWRRDVLQKALDRAELVLAGDRYLDKTAFDNLKNKALDLVKDHHRREPLSRGISRETLREKVSRDLSADMFRGVMASLAAGGTVAYEGELVRLTSHSLELSGSEKAAYERLRTTYKTAKLEPPKLEDALAETAVGPVHARKIFQLLLDRGEIVKISDEFYFNAAEIAGLVVKLKELAGQIPDRLIDVPKFKEIAGISRKYAIPLLEYFDRVLVTRRAGDKRLVMK